MAKENKPKRSRLETPFAKNLKSILEERDISQRTAAEIAGVNAATVNQWLSGSQPNDYMAVLKLCRALKCDFQWLLTDSQPQRTNLAEIGLSELFNIHPEETLSGIFMIETKRLSRKE